MVLGHANHLRAAFVQLLRNGESVVAADCDQSFDLVFRDAFR
jgi:hypothetical protein